MSASETFLLESTPAILLFDFLILLLESILWTTGLRTDDCCLDVLRAPSLAYSLNRIHFSFGSVIFVSINSSLPKHHKIVRNHKRTPKSSCKKGFETLCKGTFYLSTRPEATLNIQYTCKLKLSYSHQRDSNRVYHSI